MDALLFLASVVGIILVMLWVIQNDQAAAADPTKGLFAILTPAGRSELERRREARRRRRSTRL
jgi:hypothetical protein